MTNPLAEILFTGAISGLCVSFAQLALIAIARRRRRAPLINRPPISVLKPLCGLDDELDLNLSSFLSQTYPTFELLLGVSSAADPAYPLALELAARAPDRVRVVLQRGAPGLNPKINQLITLARAARHDLLVISDSNVRVSPNYLEDTARAFSSTEVGLVTHAIVGSGGRDLGARLDNLHMNSLIGPATIATGRIPGGTVVVGKSMALRRAVLDQLGGFAAFKDLLAEDFAMSRRIQGELKLRAVVGAERVENITISRTPWQFYDRYRRWAVMHRQAIGSLPYIAELLLLPIMLATFGVLASPGLQTLSWLSAIVTLKFGLDVLTVRALTGSLPPGSLLGDSLAKEALLLAAWLYGLTRSHVVWRGKRLRVERGTRMRALPSVGEVAA